MDQTTLVSTTYINATPERVWQGLTDPAFTRRHTWHTFTPEWAARQGFDDESRARWRSEPRSKVAFDIEEAGSGVVKLTVVNDGFGPGSGVLQGITNGWPAVLVSLKTLLETGSALPAASVAGSRPARVGNPAVRVWPDPK